MSVPEEDLEKMLLATGIRVGTPVKTKYMAPFIVKANPEGLYICLLYTSPSPRD